MKRYGKKANTLPTTQGTGGKDVSIWGKADAAIITTSSLPKDFENLSTEAQMRYIYKKEQEASKRKEFSRIIEHPRLMNEQQTLPVQLDFWTSTELAKSKTLQSAKQLQLDGKLLNAFSLGIDGDVLTLKVIQTLQEMVHEKSELYGKDGQELTGSNTLLPTAHTLPMPLFGIPKGTRYPAIFTTSYLFAKAVQGGRKPNPKEIGRIYDELIRLKNGSYLLYDTKSKKKAVLSLLDVTTLFDEKDRDFLCIELKPIFARVVGQTYVRERKDVSQYLRRKAGKAITLLLYEVLITAFSRGSVGDGKKFWITKDNLFARIAKSKGYSKNKKRMMQDFNASISMMEKIKLLLNFEYNDTGNICYFTLNKDFLKEDIKFEE